MGENSKIEWTDHTFNPWVGCTKVSPACDHCYAEAWAKRTGQSGLWRGERRRTSVTNWKSPVKWNEWAKRDGVRRKVFCASLADVWDNQVPNEWRRDLFNLIHETPQLDWLLLTKRPQNIAKMLPGAIGAVELWPWPNVWLGTTVENQDEAERRIPELLKVPARVRFLSCEPLLGHLDLTQIDDGEAHREVPREEWGSLDADDSPPALWWNALTGGRTIMHGGSTGDWSRRDASLDWIICGGESGGGKRPMALEWARDLRDDCHTAAVPFFMKQIDKVQPIPADLMIREFPF